MQPTDNKVIIAFSATPRLRVRSFAVLFILFYFFFASSWCFPQVKERFPKPDFQSGYTRPVLNTPAPRSTVQEYMDVLVLLTVLSLATYFAHRLRSRRKIFLLMIFSLVYFGFYRKGCICSVGALQNVVYASFQPAYAIPLTVIAFFSLPLLFALFFGRTFCAAVCPLGSMQDAVVLKPVKVPEWLEPVLGMIPPIYLSLTILFAATGASFFICRYDPFVGFFRFGASFSMVLFGVSMLVLGTVVARPYCRFLCPYGVLLNWMSQLSKWHVKITPDLCNNCRLCEESCPFGAIHRPSQEHVPERHRREIRRLALLFFLFPVILAGSGWAGSRLQVILSRQHPVVSLAEAVLWQDAETGQQATDAVKAFRTSGKPSQELFFEAGVVQERFRTGGWIAGGFLGLIFACKLIGLSIHKRRLEYQADRGTCLSCGRCFSYCPYEKVRLGLIPLESIQDQINPR